MEGPKIVFTIPIFGGLYITESVVLGWIIIVIITGLCIWMTHNMKKIPTKKQVVAELIVTTVNNLVKSSMGSHMMGYAPYIAALFSFSVFGSWIGLFGLRSMTADINVTMAWALITFGLITFNKFKNNGFFGYFKGYTQPVVFMTPLNIISEFATPLSMGFRHFGNVAGGMVITSLLYTALVTVSKAVHLDFTLFGGLKLDVLAVGIPAVLSVYFDLFSGFMQGFIFIMLTMAFTGMAAEKSE